MVSKRKKKKREEAHPHDKGYKYIFDSPAVFFQFLKTFVKEDWVNKIDLNSLEIDGKSFILPDFRNKELENISPLQCCVLS